MVMIKHIAIAAAGILGILCFVMLSATTHAATATVTEMCNVQVKFTASYPDSVEQGKSLTISNITVQPSKSYGFNVTSSVFDMTATNTSSATYSQNFYATNPTPTTGKNTYIGMYPNWSLDATGPVGSSVVVTLKKSLTVIQGYGGSPVTCNFTKVLATIPIVAPAASPTAPTTQTPTSPSTQSPTRTSSSSVGSVQSSPRPSVSVAPTETDKKQETTDTKTPQTTTDTETTTAEPVDDSPSVVPLSIVIRNSAGKVVQNAEVMLDNAKKLTTDDKGQVTFSNVLTGAHIITVAYKGQKITKDITLTTAATGKEMAISLPESSPSVAVIAAGVGGAVTLLAAGVGIVLLRRRQKPVQPMPSPAVAIQGVITGSVEPMPVAAAPAHIPAIPVFAAPSAQPAPAPWHPPGFASGVAMNTDATNPVQPQQAAIEPAPTTTPVEPQQPIAPTIENPIPNDIPLAQPPTQPAAFGGEPNVAGQVVDDPKTLMV